MLVILSKVLERFFTHRAIEGAKGCPCPLDRICARRGTLSYHVVSNRINQQFITTNPPSFPSMGRLNRSSRRCEIVVSIIRASCPHSSSRSYPVLHGTGWSQRILRFGDEAQ